MLSLRLLDKKLVLDKILHSSSLNLTFSSYTLLAQCIVICPALSPGQILNTDSIIQFFQSAKRRIETLLKHMSLKLVHWMNHAM